MKEKFLRIYLPINNSEYDFVCLEYYKSTNIKKCSCCGNKIKKNQIWIKLLLKHRLGGLIGWGDCLCSYECSIKHIADMCNWIIKCQ